MKEFAGKTAVITGAASGIGKAIADQCADLSMKIVLADIEETPLQNTLGEMLSRDVEAVAVQTDVANESAIKALAEKTTDTFGGVHLLFNNAGVGAPGTIWGMDPADWDWVMGVNFQSIVYTSRCFIPLMLEQKQACHIVNTASMAGLTSYAASAAYQVSKHAVVALSENLYHNLADTHIGVSVLCPSWVNTNIFDSDRNKPGAEAQVNNTNNEKEKLDYMKDEISQGMSPKDVAEMVFDGIIDEKLYILTHPGSSEIVMERAENIAKGINPEPSPRRITLT